MRCRSSGVPPGTRGSAVARGAGRSVQDNNRHRRAQCQLRYSMLTVKEAAERAQVSAALVYRWCEERRLPHYRMGRKGRRGKILISPDDLDAFVNSLKVTPISSLPPELVHIRPLS